MLHDPHRDLNLQSFRDFVASKPSHETYLFCQKHRCACGQFAKHIGLYDEWMQADIFCGDSEWKTLNSLAAPGVFEPGGIRWGDLLKRLDALLPR